MPNFQAAFPGKPVPPVCQKKVNCPVLSMLDYVYKTVSLLSQAVDICPIPF